MKRIPQIILAILIFIFFIFIFYVMQNQRLLMDERFHFSQISRFIKSDYALETSLSMGPGYHYVMSFLARIFAISTIPGMRLLHFTVSLISIPLFYLTAKKINTNEAFVKTLQYSLSSMMFVHFFMLYTDIFSVTLVLAGLFALLNKKYAIAGIIGSLSLVVRQTNIFWNILFCFFILSQNYPKRFSKIFFYLLGFLGFALFVYINKGLLSIRNETVPPIGH